MPKIVDSSGYVKKDRDIYDDRHGKTMPPHARRERNRRFSFQSQGIFGFILQIILLLCVAIFFFGVFVVQMIALIFSAIFSARRSK